MSTPAFNFGLILPGDQGKEYTMNDNFYVTDAILQGLSPSNFNVDSVPETPSTGTLFILSDTPSGIAEGHNKNLAVYTPSGYFFIPPNDNQLINAISGGFYTYISGSWRYNDTGSAYTDEQARDAAAGLFTTGAHSGVSFTYDDPANTINAQVTGWSTQAISLSANAAAIDWSRGSRASLSTVTASGDITLSFQNPPGDGSAVLYVSHQGTPRNLIFPAGTKQVAPASGNIYNASGHANSLVLIVLNYDGAHWIFNSAVYA